MNLNIEIRGSGHPLVFFHGWGFDHKIWLPIASILEKKYCLYLVDLPGFGSSSSMKWEEFKEEILKQLPECFVILGWSMGGLFATKLAVEAPERIIHLINIASSPRFIKEQNWPGVESAVFSNFFNNLATNPQQTIEEFIRLQLRNQNYQYSNEFLPRSDNLKRGLEILADWDLRENLFTFDRPTSYLFGRLDGITPSVTMTVMQKLYPDFNYMLFAKAAHMPFLSHQNEFIEYLEKLLNETNFYYRN